MKGTNTMYEDDYLEMAYEDQNGADFDTAEEPEYSDEEDETVEERVSAGMEYLDAKYPDHASRVNLNTLGVAEFLSCPLAQAAKTDYSIAVDKAGPFETWAQRVAFGQSHGFLANNAEDAESLDEEWQRQYKARA